MADPKQIADALAQDQLLAQFNRNEGQAQPWYMKPMDMEGRATFLPFKDTLPGSVMNKREFALPGLLAGAVNAFTAPGRVSTQGFDAPEEALNLATNVFGGGITTGKMMRNPTGVGGTDLALNVYHGTPHEIKGGFDLAKVGTGEGNQAFGYGTYFAENPKIATSYRDNLSKTPDSLGSIQNSAQNDVVNSWLSKSNGNRQDAAKAYKQFATDAGLFERMPDQAIETLKLIETPKGNIYKADIPDAAISKMLDWDKPLSQQPKEIQNWLSNPYNQYKKELLAKDSGGNEPYGRDIYNRLANLMSEGKGWDIGNKNASQELGSFGVTGVRYLDEGSRSTGKGTSNFVVFKPETVEILEKNGIPTRKELLQQEFDKLDK